MKNNGLQSDLVLAVRRVQEKLKGSAKKSKKSSSPKRSIRERLAPKKEEE